jgi:hypothetical protein
METAMKFSITPIAVPLLAAVTISAFVASAATSAMALEIDSDARDAQALKVAEMKLAALAREANGPIPPPPPEKAPAKKVVRAAHKKKKRKAKAMMIKGAAPDAGPKVINITSRRLTMGEVQGILSSTRDFAGTDLSGMTLVGMDFTGVKFNRANLHAANLERADLAETDLELADLSGANLRGASLNQARLRGTRLEGTRMDGALWIDKTICKKGSVGTCME